MIKEKRTMQVIAEQLHFRKGASTSHYIYKTLKKGDKVELLEILSNGWSKVLINSHNRLMSKEGYVVTQYIKEI